MLWTYFIATLVIFGLLAGWFGVQTLARAYAARHPEFGPAREEGGSCFFCLCKHKGQCTKRELLKNVPPASDPPAS